MVSLKFVGYRYLRESTDPVGGRSAKFQPASTGIHWKMMAKVDPIVKKQMKTVMESAGSKSRFHPSYSLSMPMRNGLHFVRSANLSKKKPIDSLMKLYAAIIKIE